MAANAAERIVTFGRLPDVALDEIIAQTSDRRVARHMPLLTLDRRPRAAWGELCR